MSIQEMESRVRELQELKRMKEELDAEITTIEDSIKEEMTARDTQDMTAGEYRIRWTSYNTSRIDTTTLKRDLPDIAAQYTKTTSARRFTIN